MNGKVVYFYLYDIGAFLDLENTEKMDRILAKKLSMDHVEIKKATPRYVKFPKYLKFIIEQKKMLTEKGPADITISLKMFPVGVVSYKIQVSFTDESLATLISYYSLCIIEDGIKRPIEDYVEMLHATVVSAIKDNMVRPYNVKVEPETHTVFCTTSIGEHGTSKLEMKQAAVLLANEVDSSTISDDIIADKIRYAYSYYKNDLFLIDWDAALIVEPSGDYEFILLTIELANLQLLELRTYDQYFDRVLSKAYEDIQNIFSKRNFLKSPAKILKDLSENKIDFARVNDYIVNISKFFGDWYLAKVYTITSERFYLSKWNEIVNKKMDMLNSLYVMLNQENVNKRLIILEFLVVLLFIIDVVLIYFTL